MTGHSSSITSEKVTAGLMNLHPFNQLKDGTEFRTGGGQDDKKTRILVLAAALGIDYQ
jgi:hypothetical protein